MVALSVALFHAQKETDAEAFASATQIAEALLKHTLPLATVRSCIARYGAVDRVLGGTHPNHVSSSARLLAIALGAAASVEDAQHLLHLSLEILDALPRRSHASVDLLSFAGTVQERFGPMTDVGLAGRLIVAELLTDLATAQHDPALCEHALALLPADDQPLDDSLIPIYIDTIARARTVKYQLNSDMSELHRTITFVREAADGKRVRYENSLILRRLAILHFFRYRALGYLQDLNDAIWCGEIVRAKGPDDDCYVDALVNLVAAYRQRYLITESREALERGTACAEAVLGIAEASPQAHRSAQFNLDALRMHLKADSDPETSIRELLQQAEKAGSRAEAARRVMAAAQIALGAVDSARDDEKAASLARLHVDIAEALVLAAVGLGHSAPELPSLLVQLSRLARAMDGPEGVTHSALQAALTQCAYRPLEAISMLTAWADGRFSLAEAQLVTVFLPHLVRSLFFTQLNVNDGLIASQTGAEIAIDVALVLSQHGEVTPAAGLLESAAGSVIRERLRLIGNEASDDELTRAFGLRFRTLTSGTGDRQQDLAQFDEFVAEIGPGRELYLPRARTSVAELSQRLGSVTGVVLSCGRHGSGAVLLGDGRNKPAYVDLPDLNRTAVEHALAVYRRANAERRTLFSQWLRTLDEISVWLGRTVFEPLLREVPAGSAVALVPLGGIGALPIAAATVGAGYLCELYDLTIAPNLEIATRTCVDIPPAHEVLVVSARSRPVGGRLEQFETEGRLLSSTFTGSRRLVLHPGQRDALVTELRRHTWAHLACHAHSDPSYVERSYLVLGEDDALPLRQLGLSTFENTHVVVLSGCETGVSTDWAPSEFWGMTGAMLSGGVRRVLASSWAVDDTTTLLVMLEMYRQLRAGVGHHDALRRAQEAVRHGTVRPEWLQHLDDWEAAWITCGGAKHPYYWASHGWYGSAVTALGEE
ncbi:hypothetical protein DLJ59_06245 [Micromonospora inaquosa]|uniref:CHAT domain-containing protein n=2 Tax=Micromonospora inaquosa TaxID=2203716 RepID=A0A3N9WYF5_9ACTN|nr:hypothetical protein DLJ59_06245 [Micromonospora inaquosa]